jgi:hypothetical protein
MQIVLKKNKQTLRPVLKTVDKKRKHTHKKKTNKRKKTTKKIKTVDNWSEKV